jgi:ABC-type multidrug transport system ATPase subunit
VRALAAEGRTVFLSSHLMSEMSQTADQLLVIGRGRIIAAGPVQQGIDSVADDPAAARNQYAALLPVEERVLGPEHRYTLTIRHELARWTGQAGDAAAARDQDAALLPVEERVLGPEHSDTLTDRHELARWTGQAERGSGSDVK